jgi:hypothetical protein
MQLIRTIGLVLLAMAFSAFVAMNWESAPVRFWPLGNGDFLRFDWPVGFTAVFFFGLGLVPMWLLAKAARWRLMRRIAALETSLHAVTADDPTLVASTSQLDAASLNDRTH